MVVEKSMENSLPTEIRDFYVVCPLRESPYLGSNEKEEGGRSRRCPLYMQNEETTQHLLLEFPFQKKYWSEIYQLSNLPLLWIGDTVQD